jgi:hypothetical protein
MEESSSNLPMYMYSYPWITDGWTDGLHSVAYGGPALDCRLDTLFILQEDWILLCIIRAVRCWHH